MDVAFFEHESLSLGMVSFSQSTRTAYFLVGKLGDIFKIVSMGQKQILCAFVYASFLYNDFVHICVWYIYTCVCEPLFCAYASILLFYQYYIYDDLKA